MLLLLLSLLLVVVVAVVQLQLQLPLPLPVVVAVAVVAVVVVVVVVVVAAVIIAIFLGFITIKQNMFQTKRERHIYLCPDTKSAIFRSRRASLESQSACVPSQSVLLFGFRVQGLRKRVCARCL